MEVASEDTKETPEVANQATSSKDPSNDSHESQCGNSIHTSITEETSTSDKVDNETELVTDQQHTCTLPSEPTDSCSSLLTVSSSNSTNLVTGKNDFETHESSAGKESSSLIADKLQVIDTTKESLSFDNATVPVNDSNLPTNSDTAGAMDNEERTLDSSASPELLNSSVYSSVVSPLVGSGTRSPLNTLSLDEEIVQAEQKQNFESEHTVSSETNSKQLMHIQSASATITTINNDQNGSPTGDDRHLEQFSEILLDSDVESEEEVQSTEGPKKTNKRVRFADELESKDSDGGVGGSRSPPPRPNLPFVKSTSESSKHPGVPVSPSLKSPEQSIHIAAAHHTTDELIAGVEYPAEYLGSTPIILAGAGAIKSARMHQAQQAVQLIKDPENDSRPHFSVKVKISTQAVKIADGNSDVDMMEHPLHSIAYVADIDGVLVIMAYVSPYLEPSSPQATEHNQSIDATGFTPKMTCHVLDAADARHVAMVIGQAFGAAYKEFLMSIGVSEDSLEEAEYTHILNAQTVPQVEVDSLSDRSKTKKITMAKHKGEMMGIMVMESGYGSAIPACVIAHMSKTGSASRSGLLNVGDHIISLNGVSLVGMPRKLCNEQIKKCRQLNVVKMVICSCPPVVDVTMMRPDLKYQLGFTIQDGMICSLTRGSIAERSGIRVSHRIIEINGTSTVNMQHRDIVHLLSSTVGDLHIRTMPDLLYKLFTGKILPEYY